MANLLCAELTAEPNKMIKGQWQQLILLSHLKEHLKLFIKSCCRFFISSLITRHLGLSRICQTLGYTKKGDL